MLGATFTPGSPDAWDLLWAIPDNAIVDSTPPSQSAAVVRRVAPCFYVDQLPQHLNNAQNACERVTAAAPTTSAPQPDRTSKLSSAANAVCSSNSAKELISGSAAEDPAAQGHRVPTDDIVESVVADCQPRGAADLAGDDTPQHLRAPTSSIGSQPSCSADSSPERAAWGLPPNHELATAVSVSTVDSTLACIVGGAPQVKDGCCLGRADTLAGSPADFAAVVAGGATRLPPGGEDGSPTAAGTMSATAAAAVSLTVGRADLASSSGSLVAEPLRPTAAVATAVCGSGRGGPGGAPPQPQPGLAPQPHPSTTGAAPEAGGVAALDWSLELLRRMCPIRDPRLRHMQQQQQRQQQQQQQESEDLEAQSRGQKPHAATSAAAAASREGPYVVARAGPGGVGSGHTHVKPDAASHAADAQPAMRQQQQPAPAPAPAPAPPLRRGPTTTTARLLMRLRPATAGTAAARVRQHQSSAAATEVGAAGGVASTGGRKRKGGREGAVRRTGLTALFAAAYGSDESDSGYTTDVEFGSKQKPAAAAAEVHASNAAAQPLLPRPAWQLPPLRGRFDFLTRRRAAAGPSVAAAAAAVPAAGQVAAGGRCGSCRACRQRSVEGCDCVDGDEGEQSSFDDLIDSVASESERGSPGGRTRHRRAAAAPHPPPTLQQSLEAWRTERSRSIRKAPEALLRLGLLVGVADRCPTSVLALEAVPGLPRPFVRRYGQEVLDVCRNHAHLEAARVAAAAAAARAHREAAAALGAGGGGGDGPAAAAFSGRDDCSGRHQRVAERGPTLGGAMNRSRLPSCTAAAEAAGGGAGEAGQAPRSASGAEDGRQDGLDMGLESGCGEAAGCHEVGTAPDGPTGHVACATVAKQRMRQQLLGILGWQTKASSQEPTCPSATGPSGSQPLVASRDANRGCDRAVGSGSNSDCVDNGVARSTTITTGRTTGRGAASLSQPAKAAEAWLAAGKSAAPGAALARGLKRGRPLNQAADGREASAPAASGDGETKAAEAGSSAVSPPTRKSSGVKRPMGEKGPPGAGCKATEGGAQQQVRKLGCGDSPRAAATAAAAATMAAPEGWLPLPAGCRARSGRHLAYAATPSLNCSRVNSLLGILAEAGPAAAPFLAVMSSSHFGSREAAAASTSPGDATDGVAAAEPLGSVVDAGAEAAALPAAVLAIATAAQSLGRTAALMQVRRLRAMTEAVLPAWEVRRVLACLTLGSAAQPGAVLRLSSGASRDAVRLAFRRLSLLVHPDKNRSPGAAEAFALVSAAAAKMMGGGLS